MEIGLSTIVLYILGLPTSMVIGLPILIEVLQIGVYIFNERIWSKITWETSHEGHICEACHVPSCKCPYGKHDENGKE